MGIQGPMECDQSEIVGNLLASYQEVGGINNIDGSNLPSKNAIPGICRELLQILFPGFIDEEAVVEDQMLEMTRARVASLMEHLSVEMARSLKCSETQFDDISAEARSIICDFLNTLPAIRALLRTDVEAAYEGDPAAKGFGEIILAYPCIEAIAIQRCAHVLYKKNVPLLPRMLTEWSHAQTGIDIHPGASIGSHFFIDHGTGVVIGETCQIGSNVKLYHGVTLGARSFAKDEDGKIVKGIKRHPNVENNVTIYPNATILGGDTVIGEGSTIGGNVFLMESVAPHSLVALGSQDQRILDKRSK